MLILALLLAGNVAAESVPASEPAEATTWLTAMSPRIAPFVKHPDQRHRLLRAVFRQARLNRLPPELVLAVIHTESTFDRFAISPVGAQGLMQVMPFWKHELGQPEDNLTAIDTNIRYGSTILAYYLRQEQGDLTRALARYNGRISSTAYARRVYANLIRYR